MVIAWKVWIILGIAGFSFALAILGFWIASFQRKAIKETEALLNKTHFAVNSLNQSVTGIGRRLMQMESQVQALALKQGDGAGTRATETDFYKRAGLLAEKGADVDELVRVCGVTVAEAELITYLNQDQK